MIEIEVQNETTQTEERLRFAAVPRIGEGIRLQGPDGFWASYDVVDLWYQKAAYGDVWVPYLHVRLTPAPGASEPVPGPNVHPLGQPVGQPLGHPLGQPLAQAMPSAANGNSFGVQEVYPFTA